MTITTSDPFTPGQLASLRSACQGAVSIPGEDPYQEEIATWNLAVGLRPALAVGARTTDDVVAAVRWAARLGLAVGVNATGHGAVPNADVADLVLRCLDDPATIGTAPMIASGSGRAGRAALGVLRTLHDIVRPPGSPRPPAQPAAAPEPD